MEKEYILIEDVLNLLEIIRADLNYKDWNIARDYIDVEIKHIQEHRKIKKPEDARKLNNIIFDKLWQLLHKKWCIIYTKEGGIDEYCR